MPSSLTKDSSSSGQTQQLPRPSSHTYDSSSLDQQQQQQHVPSSLTRDSSSSFHMQQQQQQQQQQSWPSSHRYDSSSPDHHQFHHSCSLAHDSIDDRRNLAAEISTTRRRITGKQTVSTGIVHSCRLSCAALHCLSVQQHPLPSGPGDRTAVIAAPVSQGGDIEKAKGAPGTTHHTLRGSLAPWPNSAPSL